MYPQYHTVGVTLKNYTPNLDKSLESGKVIMGELSVLFELQQEGAQLASLSTPSQGRGSSL